MFINRDKELTQLEAVFHKPDAQFLAVFGRRRIGKTALLCHWLQTRRHPDGVYWVAYRSSSRLLLARFSQSLQSLTGNRDPDFTYSNWDVAFREMARLASNRRRVVVIDEWPYLVESVPGIASILQAAWDHHLKASKIVLIVAGSHYHMMHDDLLSPRGPLYGRTTANLMLGEIPPREMRQFLPRYSLDQIVETYSVIGGVPKYLELWNDGWPILRNIEEIVLSPTTIFRQEPAFLIQDEISDARTYLGILEALGQGMRTPSTISTVTGIAQPHVGKYLQSLLLLGLIRRDISIDAPNLHNTRIARYEISDPYLRFHFTFVRPHTALLEQGRIRHLMGIIKERFDAYVAHTGYEEMCRRIVTELGDQNELPFIPDRIGRIWTRHSEVDIAAASMKDRCVLFGECKWSRHKIGLPVLNELKAKAVRLDRLREFKHHFALFSRSGFEARLLREAAKDGALLFAGLQKFR